MRRLGLAVRLGIAGRQRLHCRHPPLARTRRQLDRHGRRYGLGHSEEVVAPRAEDWRGSRPYVFTKCGLRWGFKGEVHKVLSADSNP